ncbi:DUF3043 domain-containing protein [Rothia sp. P7181]|uniref:DUF3043 domain-containing protein n=1 Tax=Rothia sp. P7181 TaxID=3402663 RepID=UPI003AE09F57
MFGRKKKSSEQEPLVEETTVAPNEDPQNPHYTAPKGRPTPSRKEREAARKKPLIPADRKAAKQAEREAIREQRLRENRAMHTGEERYLPARDKGPQRRYIRDYVDARFNIGDFMILAVIFIFVLGLFTPQLRFISTALMWLFILIWAFDSWMMWRKLKKKLLEKFSDIEPGSAFYAVNRVLMIRRFRLPKPQVKRGEYPR